MHVIDKPASHGETAQRPIRSAIRYLAGCRVPVLLTSPLLYVGLIPLAQLDLFLTLLQAVCFRLWGVPRVRRSDYLVFDRSKLRYLNAVERLNCAYCSYANGLFAYAVEIGARTEQHWCPIRHSRSPLAPHSRYGHFLKYADPASYGREVETVRRDFADESRDGRNGGMG